MRGLSNYEIYNLRGAIIDFTMTVALDSNKDVAYFNRGMAKYLIKDYNAACIDWSKAGELGNSDSYDFIKKYCK